MSLDHTINRRTAARFLASGPLIAGTLLQVDNASAKQSAPSVRDPLVTGIEPTVIGENDTFRVNRGLEIILNTDDYSETGAQNNLDLAVHEMFNVMNTNKWSVESGEIVNYLAQGYTPVGTTSEEFTQLLDTSQPGELLIPIYHYPDWATGEFDYELGFFDPKKGLELIWIDEPGLFQISNLAGAGQVYGLTPRITTGQRLRIETYQNQSHFQDQPGFTADDQRSWAHTAQANMIMQIAMISYGNWEYFHSPSGRYFEELTNPPNFINARIASLLSGTPESNQDFFSGVYQPYLLLAEPISN